MIKIALGADHRGFVHKQLIMAKFNDPKYELIDVGTDSTVRTDFPIYTNKVIDLIKNNVAHLGLLFCGSGIGMAIAANRHYGIYAGVVWNVQVAQKAKEHNNTNILILPSDYITDDQVIPIINAWLHATFNGGRYQERIDMIDSIL